FKKCDGARTTLSGLWSAGEADVRRLRRTVRSGRSQCWSDHMHRKRARAVHFGPTNPVPVARTGGGPQNASSGASSHYAYACARKISRGLAIAHGGGYVPIHGH